MRKTLAVAMIGVALLMAPRLAAAQTSAPDARIYAGGLAGVTFGSETGAIFGGRVGFRVARNLHVFAEVGRITDVTPKELSDQIDEALEVVPDDIALTFEVKVPSTYFIGGARWSQTRGRFGPFVEGGIGVGHLTLDATLIVDGVDLSNDLRELIGDNDSMTKVLFAFGGGVNITVTPIISVDTGYRFTYIATEDPSVKCSAVYGMVNFRIK